MNTPDDGGPEFPVTDEQSISGISATHGMTLRDYFAAAAMQGWMASFDQHSRHPADCDGGTEKVSIISYAMADAMIAERDGKRES